VAENQPGKNKTAMTTEFSHFVTRLHQFIEAGPRCARPEPPSAPIPCPSFNTLALELFKLQHAHNIPYRQLCEAKGLGPGAVEHWSQIPPVPAGSFKELEFTCLDARERTAVFHSSGTTGQQPSRHFHSPDSLKLYGRSLWQWFRHEVVPELPSSNPSSAGNTFSLLLLTPPPELVPHSSLGHMFETVRREMGAPQTSFVGMVAADKSWTVDFHAALTAMRDAVAAGLPVVMLGTAFGFVHMADWFAEQNLRLELPAGSRVMETGGYKGRSRVLSKPALHSLISRQLGVPRSQIVSEYGMSELSSQAYDRAADRDGGRCGLFQFPPWARARIVSPETGGEVSEGEPGLICIYDLANAFSVMAVQTEDLAVRRGNGFELLGRRAWAEPRGCSLVAAG